MSQISDFEEKVLDWFKDHITDAVFLCIQNNRELMQEYLDLIQKHGIDGVNPQIGKAVKKRFNLENEPSREYEPVSTLITSHQMFECWENPHVKGGLNVDSGSSSE